MGQLVEGCGIPLEDWLPHQKMPAGQMTTAPRMQQDPRCRCLRHLIERALEGRNIPNAFFKNGTLANAVFPIVRRALRVRLFSATRCVFVAFFRCVLCVSALRVVVHVKQENREDLEHMAPLMCM